MSRGALRYCLLALLHDGERPGFEIVLDLAGEGGLSPTEGVVYPLLAQMRARGLVTARWRELEPGKPRHCYAITDEGTAALADFVERWADFRDRVDTYLGRAGG